MAAIITQQIADLSERLEALRRPGGRGAAGDGPERAFGAIRPRMTPPVARPARAQPPEDRYTCASPAEAAPSVSPANPKACTGPSAPVPCRPCSAAVIAPQARILKVKS